MGEEVTIAESVSPDVVRLYRIRRLYSFLGGGTL